MRILQINNCHYRRGGADSVYLNTVQLLCKNGNEVFEFSQKNKENEYSKYSTFFVKEFDSLKLPFYKKFLKTPRQLYSFEAAVKLDYLLKHEKIDIAHIHLYKGVLTASILLVLKKHRIPTCITLHDYSLLCPRNILFDGDNKICEKCIKSSTINCVLKRCNRKKILFSIVSFLEFNINNTLFKPENYFKKIISVSKFNYEKHFVKPNLQNKLVHLYNFFPDCENIKTNDIKGSYFLYFGRLSNEKGLNTLISAFSKNTLKYKLKIVGTGLLFDSLHQIINSKGLSNIELLGYKSGNELNELILNCSFIIVPSEWYENNPMTIVEGYSFGKPVIGSRVGGIPELIIDNETGYNFEMGNVDDLEKKMSLAASLSINEYKNMSVKARNFAIDNFSEATHYEKLMEIYYDMIK